MQTVYMFTTPVEISKANIKNVSKVHPVQLEKTNVLRACGLDAFSNGAKLDMIKTQLADAAEQANAKAGMTVAKYSTGVVVRTADGSLEMCLGDDKLSGREITKYRVVTVQRHQRAITLIWDYETSELLSYTVIGYNKDRVSYYEPVGNIWFLASDLLNNNPGSKY